MYAARWAQDGEEEGTGQVDCGVYMYLCVYMCISTHMLTHPGSQVIFILN
jgi:hypothetical protein